MDMITIYNAIFDELDVLGLSPRHEHCMDFAIHPTLITRIRFKGYASWLFLDYRCRIVVEKAFSSTIMERRRFDLQEPGSVEAILKFCQEGLLMFKAGRYCKGESEASREAFLKCIHEFLCERQVSAKLYQGYIAVQRRRKLLNIAFTDETEVTVEVTERRFNSNGVKITSDVDVVGCGVFDICNPNSLQGIYEFVMSKKNK